MMKGKKVYKIKKRSAITKNPESFTTINQI